MSALIVVNVTVLLDKLVLIQIILKQEALNHTFL